MRHLLLTSTLLLGACMPSCGETPVAFQPLEAELQAFSTLEATLAWADPSTGSRSVVEVQGTPSSAVLDVVQGSGGTVRWSEDRGVKVGGDDLSIPVPSMNGNASELWEELRSGLDDSTWTACEAPSRAPLAPPAGISWAELDLPFDWAANVDITVGVDEKGTPRHVVLDDRNPPLDITVAMLRGGPRTVTLSEQGRLWVVLEDWTTRP